MNSVHLSLTFDWRFLIFSGLVVTYPGEIDPKENATAHYEKRSMTATGSAFMLTYDLTNSSEKVYAKVIYSDLCLLTFYS